MTGTDLSITFGDGFDQEDVDAAIDALGASGFRTENFDVEHGADT